MGLLHNGAMARIAIVGAGAIGSVLAALLQSTEQHELILCTRRPLPHLHVDTPEGSIDIRYTNLTSPSQADPSIGSWWPPRLTMLLVPAHGSNISAGLVLPSR